MVGFLLSASGFVAGQEQTEETLFVLRLLSGGIPMICYFTGILLFMRFRLTRSEHAKIRREIDTRRAQMTSPG